MLSYLTTLEILLPIFCLMAMGGLLRRIQWLNDEAESSLLKLIIHLLYPALILESLLGNPALAHWGNLLQAPLAGFFIIIASITFAYAICPFFKIKETQQRRTFSVATAIFNYSYLALPVVQRLFGDESVALLILFNFGVEIAMWTVGLTLLAGKQKQNIARRLFNPPIIAILLGVLLNLTHTDSLIPQWVNKTLVLLGQCAVPLGLMAIGSLMLKLAKTLSGDRSWNIISAACLMRVGLLPLLMIVAAVALPLSQALKEVIIVQAAMPSAIFPIVLAQYYNAKPATALQVALATLFVSFFTSPLWLKWGIGLIS